MAIKIKNLVPAIATHPGEILKDELQRAESLADGIYLLFDGAVMSSKVFGNSWPVFAAHKIALELL